MGRGQAGKKERGRGRESEDMGVREENEEMGVGVSE